MARHICLHAALDARLDHVGMVANQEAADDPTARDSRVIAGLELGMAMMDGGQAANPASQRSGMASRFRPAPTDDAR